MPSGLAHSWAADCEVTRRAQNRRARVREMLYRIERCCGVHPTGVPGLRRAFAYDIYEVSRLSSRPSAFSTVGRNSGAPCARSVLRRSRWPFAEVADGGNIAGPVARDDAGGDVAMKRRIWPVAYARRQPVL